MKTYALYGLFIALAGAALNYVSHFLGYNDLSIPPTASRVAGTMVLGLIGFIVPIVGIFFGIRAARESSPDRSLTYGRGVLAGTAIGFLAGVFGAVFGYIYSTAVNPTLAAQGQEMMLNQVNGMGLPEKLQELAVNIATTMSNPIVVALGTIIITPLFACIISLIFAAILKRNAVVLPPPITARP